MGIRTHFKRAMSEYGWRASRRGLVAGIVVFLVLFGSGASYAAWSALVTVTSTSSAATLAISTTNFTSNAYTFQNQALTTTGSVAVSNTTTTTSSTVPALTLAFDISAGDSTLASNLQLRVWPNTLGACVAATATPGAATSGTWNSFPAVVTTLAKSTSVTYCVRSYAVDRSNLSNATGTTSITPRITASLSVYNFTASAVATTTQSTQLIFPATGPNQYAWYQVKSTVNGDCLDVFGGNTASGTSVIDWPCKTIAAGNTNQLWRFVQASGSYYDVQALSTPALRWDNSASTTDLAPITVNTNNDALLGQQWLVQQVSSGVYQFVNALSGMCIEPNDTAVTTAVEYSQSPCDGSAAQKLTLTPSPVVTLSCANTGAGNARRVTFSWTPTNPTTFTFQADKDLTSATNWLSIGSAAANSSSLAITGTAPVGDTLITWPVGLYDVQILDTSNIWQASSTVRVNNGTAGAKYLTCT
jgi:Ricin-type beta-trefoil lectin domain-like